MLIPTARFLVGAILLSAVLVTQLRCAEAIEVEEPGRAGDSGAWPIYAEGGPAAYTERTERLGDGVTASRRNALVRAIEEAGPAVVTINVISIQRERIFDRFYFDFFDPFGMPRRGYRTRERQIESIGSGFFFDDNGHILTNYHVIDNAHAISVSLPDGRNIEVDVVGGDEITDLAVLRARGSDLPRARLGDSADLLIGEWVIAIGNPFGTLMNDPQPSVSVGVVSANNRRVAPQVTGQDRFYQDMIQTDAAINPGNSGGPLVNALGQVVGVNTMIFSQSGGSVGLGFAIPINRARRVAQEILDYGRRRNPWPGFRVEDVRAIDRVALRRAGVQADTGCLVVAIREDAPAYRAGLRTGDVITAINGEKVVHPSDVDYAVWSQFVGDEMVIEADRQGRPVEVSFELRELQP